MRNPSRKALYCILVLLAGAALISFGMSREQQIGEHWTAVLPIVLGFAVLPFAFVILIQALLAWRGQTVLISGHGVIARWHVDPAEWERFRERDAQRSSQDPTLHNDLWIRKETPSSGVDVIVGEKSLLVDRSYHVLRPRGLPELRSVAMLEGLPTCLEFGLSYPRGRYGGTLRLTLRIPVPHSAMAAAQLVLAHFEPLTRRTPALALRNPAKTFRICFILFMLSAGSAFTGYYIALSLPDGADPLWPLLLLIGGIGLGIFALVLALATFLLMRRP